jgi:serine/threonine protein kinase
MTDGPHGPGWWQAADLKWYPPDKRPDYGAALPPPPAADAAQQQPADSTLAATPTPQQGPKPAKTRQVIPRDKLGVLSKIGQGGQGVVYRAPNVKTKFAASMVYKEYKLQARTDIDFTALAAMPALVEESLTYTQAERLISIAAWPCAIIEDAGTPTGFVMPAIPDEFFIALTTVKGVSTSTAEFQHLLNHPSVLVARGITLDDAQRYTLLRETASALAFLHKHGVCVGDISPKNLLFSLAPHEAVYFIVWTRWLPASTICVPGRPSVSQTWQLLLPIRSSRCEPKKTALGNICGTSLVALPGSLLMAKPRLTSPRTPRRRIASSLRVLTHLRVTCGEYPSQFRPKFRTGHLFCAP